MKNQYYSEYGELADKRVAAMGEKARALAVAATKDDAKQDYEGWAELGKALGNSGGKPFDPQGQTQTSGYKAYRAGERASY